MFKILSRSAGTFEIFIDACVAFLAASRRYRMCAGDGERELHTHMGRKVSNRVCRTARNDFHRGNSIYSAMKYNVRPLPSNMQFFYTSKVICIYAKYIYLIVYICYRFNFPIPLQPPTNTKRCHTAGLEIAIQSANATRTFRFSFLETSKKP